MSSTGLSHRSGRAATLAALVGAAHAGPTVAVTTLAALLGAAADLDAGTVVLVTLAVLTGQLTIGWGNDLVDASRDRAVGRSDKPLASGRVSSRLVGGCLGGALLLTLALSLALGWRAGVVHLALVVAMGHAYNLGLKATALSWLPYAIAFGALPAVPSLAGTPSAWPAWWLLAAGAALGVGAHLVNAVPDLADDARTGVRGLPHRLGERGSRVAAAGLLAAASLLAALGPGAPSAWTYAVLVVVLTLAAVAAVGRGRLPFQAAIAVALVDVVLLVVAG